MTTRVVISNMGCKPVKVEVQGRDSGGKFVAAEEKILPVAGTQEFYVHSNQSLQIIEAPED